MAIKLNKVELDITREIINIGLSKSADSLSFFIKGKVMINIFDLKLNEDNYSPMSRKYNVKKSYLLTTHIKGDIKGKAYLVLNEMEVEKIIDANLPESIKNDPIERVKMTDAFLLEIDNIITASVVTQFANILSCKIYGDVPSLNVMESNAINEFLSNDHSNDLNRIYFNSRFKTENVDINPEFIWLLDDTFFDSIKNLVSDEKKVELFHKLNAAN